MTLKELIERAVAISGRGLDAVLADTADVVTEPLVAVVFDQVSREVARDWRLRPLLRRTKVIAFANGSGTIPEDVLTEYLCESVLLDAASITKRYSWVPEFPDFVHAHEDRLGYYHVNESTIRIREPGVDYSPTSGLTGSRDLTIPCSIVVPTALANPVVARDELLERLIARLGQALKPTP